MLTMRQKKAVTRELRDRYRRASKKEKGMMLNEFIQISGYNRCYACQILNVKKVLGYLNITGKRIKYIAPQSQAKFQSKSQIFFFFLLIFLPTIYFILLPAIFRYPNTFFTFRI